MAVKTITIDLEAYDLLSQHKLEGQSFSQVIKAHFGERPTAGRLLARIRAGQMSDPLDADAVKVIRQLIRDRKLDPARWSPPFGPTRYGYARGRPEVAHFPTQIRLPRTPMNDDAGTG